MHTILKVKTDNVTGNRKSSKKCETNFGNQIIALKFKEGFEQGTQENIAK